jgi:hypothetical protein
MPFKHPYRYPETSFGVYASDAAQRLIDWLCQHAGNEQPPFQALELIVWESWFDTWAKANDLWPLVEGLVEVHSMTKNLQVGLSSIIYGGMEAYNTPRNSQHLIRWIRQT